MKKLFALASSAVLALSLTLSVSANTVFYKDFRVDQTLEPLIQNDSNEFEATFSAEGGMRLTFEGNNVCSPIIPFEESGIVLDSGNYYLVTFEGKVAPEYIGNQLIIQLFCSGGVKPDGVAGDWFAAYDLEGNLLGDTGAFTINDDGTFKCEGLFTPEQISTEINPGEFQKLCLWGVWGNTPRDYEVYYMKVEEADANGVPLGGTAETTETDSGASAGDTNAVTTDKASANTGVEGIAVVAGVAVIAAGAVIISRKRK